MWNGYPGWVNLEDYTPLELVLFGVGCWLWVIAYIIIIRNIRRYKFAEMPTIAGAGNFAWEGVFSWIPPATNMGRIAFWAYHAWFFLDLYIWYFVGKYSQYDTRTKLFRKYKWSYFIIVTLLWAIGFQLFRMTGIEYIIGARTAWILNIVIAIQYVVNYLRLGPKYPFSVHVAWLKGMGTGLNTVFVFVHFPQDYFVQFLGVVLGLCDIWYFSMVFRDRILRKIRPDAAPLPVPEAI